MTAPSDHDPSVTTDTPAHSAPTPATAGAHPYARLGGDVLTFGFLTTAVLWILKFFALLPIGETEAGEMIPLFPNWLLIPLIGAIIFAGSFLATRKSTRGTRTGLYVGLLVGTLNLIVMSSLLGADQRDQLRTDGLYWLIGSIVAGGAIGMLGGFAGTRKSPATTETAPPERNWVGGFARVAGFVTLCMLGLGGVVTGAEAGLAVADWPNTDGYLMVLYPLTKMTGGVYYEHSHRLFGLLVGLTTLAFVIYLWIADNRWTVRIFGALLVALVIVQGILGGIRVTDTSRELAVLHGVLGQVFFALIVVAGALTATTWHASKTQPKKFVANAGTDFKLLPMFVALLVVQLILGAVLRHFYWGLHLHITVGMVAAFFATFCGVRAKIFYKDIRLLKRFGGGVMHVAWMQVLLGFGAWVVGGGQGQRGSTVAETEMITKDIAASNADVIFTTIHQVTGALVLMYAVLLTVWTFRLVTATAPKSAGESASDAASQPA